MYLQKYEEHFAGESIGADEKGDLYKGVVCFMIVGLKNNIPYVVMALPEKDITGKWLMFMSILTNSSSNSRQKIEKREKVSPEISQKIPKKLRNYHFLERVSTFHVHERIDQF